ncbi:MAG: cell division protein FtsH, partial [Mariprofundaceae bacterium]
GGRIAEELELNQMTTGASNDIERATQIARNMVTVWGMSEKLGPMVYGEREEEIFVGREITRHQNVSEGTAKQIDAEIRKLIDSNYTRSKKILTEQNDKLHLLAEALIEYETLEGDEIDLILAGKKLDKSDHEQSKKTPPNDTSSASAPRAGAKVVGTKEAGQGA